jgi:hypothetical protein
MAAAFVAMNETYGPLYVVSRAEAQTPEMANERAKALKSQFVMDMHTHFLRDDTKITAFVAQRATVGKLGWNPQIGEKEQTIDDLKFPELLQGRSSSTATPKVACISGSYSVKTEARSSTNDMKYAAREKVNKEAGTKRMFSHAIFTAGRDGWLDKVEEEEARLKPDSWKGYTIGDNTNKHLSKWPFRLDDEKVMYPFYEKLVRWSKTSPTKVNVCIHKGLFPPEIEASSRISSSTRTCATSARPRRTGRNSTSSSTTRAGAGRAPTRRSRRGSTSRRPAASSGSPICRRSREVRREERLRRPGPALRLDDDCQPALGAAVMGQLVKRPGRRPRGLGHRRGVDRLAAMADRGAAPARDSGRHAEEYGYKPLGAADGPVKTAIFGGNNARLYRVRRSSRPRSWATASRRSRKPTRNTVKAGATCATGILPNQLRSRRRPGETAAVMPPFVFGMPNPPYARPPRAIQPGEPPKD